MPLRHLPLRRQLVIVIMATSGAALVLAIASSLAFDYAFARRDLALDLLGQAEVAAEASAASLAVGDADAARETLAVFGGRTELARACLYDHEGRPFARYVRAGVAEACPPAPDREGWVFDAGHLRVARTVRIEERPIGWLAVDADLSRIWTRLERQALVAAAVLLLSLVAAYGLSSRLQTLVAEPILELADTARAVSSRGDYRIRANIRGGGEIGLLVAAFNDMLALIQRRDRELQLVNEGLEERVAERTRALEVELAERRRAEGLLEQRNRELLRSNQDLDDFAHIASHDLREPLRGIQIYASFIVEDYGPALDAEGQSRLETLGRLARRMESLVESLLHYSQVGRQDLAVADVDLGAVVGEVIDSLAVSLAQAGAEIRLTAPLPVVRCDRARVGEVFRNLVVNAMKYNDKPLKTIDVGSMGGTPPVFYVRDNGIGIAARHVSSVFRIFKRLHGRDQYGGGTGAGLTIVRKIIERHAGAIWIDSTPGQGTTVHFTLGPPARDQADPVSPGGDQPDIAWSETA